MNRTRSTVYVVVMGLAAVALATLVAAGVLLLTRYAVYQQSSASARSPLAHGTHVLVRTDVAARDGDVVVFHDARHADDQLGRMGEGTITAGEVRGVVIRQGSLPTVLGYPLMRAAVVGVPAGALVALIVGLCLVRRRPQPDTDEVAVAVAATDVVPMQRSGDHAEALGDAGLALVLADEGAARST